MKIIFEDEDKDLAELIKEGKTHLKQLMLGPMSTKCSIELEVTDPYKCDIFLRELMYNNDLKTKLSEECGFKAKAVSLNGVYSDYNNLKEELHCAINQVLHDHNII